MEKKLNIAYAGSFLREGLKIAGHNVIDIAPHKTGSVPNSLKALNQPVDLVFLEFFGSSIPLNDLEKCNCRLAAWCIDSALNEFWFSETAFLFDHVFVDQQILPGTTSGAVIPRRWLPLCCPNSYFVDKAEKIHDITFVGTINELRPKRKNLVRLLAKYFKMNIAQNISMDTMLHMFAQSKIVLNENLFPGLTLRVLQGLASGSLVATEGIGMEGLFADGFELAKFTTDDLVEKLDFYLKNPEERESVAAKGREKCLKFHTSSARAQQFCAYLADKNLHNRKTTDVEAKWHRLYAQYLFTLRFGGNLGPLTAEFGQFAKAGKRYAGEAHLCLGDILACSGKGDMAAKHYQAAIALLNDHKAFLRMAKLYICSDELPRAKAYMNLAFKKIPESALPPEINALNSLKDDKARLYYMAAITHMGEGRIFDLGFYKPYEDKVCDNAFDMAQKLWQYCHSPAAMEIMLGALSPYGLQGELLPHMLEGLKNGCLPDSLKVKMAEVALAYYDFETADAALAAYGKA